MAKRKGLIKFPNNVFEWKKAFGDDFGYEATIQPEPVDYPPGSPEKIAAGHRDFIDDGWNRVRIVARGPRIQTWVNGKPIEDVVSDFLEQGRLL